MGRRSPLHRSRRAQGLRHRRRSDHRESADQEGDVRGDRLWCEWGSEAQAQVEGFESGAVDYITKPINFAELEARVNSLLRIKALQSALSARERELSELNDEEQDRRNVFDIPLLADRLAAATTRRADARSGASAKDGTSRNSTRERDCAGDG